MEDEVRKKLYEFMRSRRLAVIATAGKDAIPEAALIEIAVTKDLEIIFETTTATRKLPNLRANPHVAIVIGWEASQTLRCDGLADEPQTRGWNASGRIISPFFRRRRHTRVGRGIAISGSAPYWGRLSDYDQPRRIEEYQLAPGPDPSSPHRSIGGNRFWQASRLRHRAGSRAQIDTDQGPASRRMRSIQRTWETNMDCKTIMVRLELGQSNKNLLAITADLAQRLKAGVIGIAACQPIQIVYDATYVAGEILAEVRKQSKSRSRKPKASSGPSSRTRSPVSDGARP